MTIPERFADIDTSLQELADAHDALFRRVGELEKLMTGSPDATPDSLENIGVVEGVEQCNQTLLEIHNGVAEIFRTVYCSKCKEKDRCDVPRICGTEHDTKECFLTPGDILRGEKYDSRG